MASDIEGKSLNYEVKFVTDILEFMEYFWKDLKCEIARNRLNLFYSLYWLSEAYCLRYRRLFWAIKQLPIFTSILFA